MSTQHHTKVATVQSVALTGFNGALIEVETDIKAGLPSLQIVGMGNKAIDEARQRVRSAITNSLLEFPARKVTVNLAPAELPKDGTHLDLPIASGQLKPSEAAGAVFAGELALNGTVRSIRGAIVVTEAARNAGAHTVFVPVQNAAQARLVSDITVVGVSNLTEIFRHLRRVALLPDQATDPSDQTPALTISLATSEQSARLLSLQPGATTFC
jgi:magnesium chelatase family protein